MEETKEKAAALAAISKLNELLEEHKRETAGTPPAAPERPAQLDRLIAETVYAVLRRKRSLQAAARSAEPRPLVTEHMRAMLHFFGRNLK